MICRCLIRNFSHIEFDEKVRENPMNEHLIVKEVPTEERNVTVDYNDAFFYQSG